MKASNVFLKSKLTLASKLPGLRATSTASENPYLDLKSKNRAQIREEKSQSSNRQTNKESPDAKQARFRPNGKLLKEAPSPQYLMDKDVKPARVAHHHNRSQRSIPSVSSMAKTFYASSICVPPYQLQVPRKSDLSSHQRHQHERFGIVTDNSPLLRSSVDSSLNNRIAGGTRFNKRVQIAREDSPKQDYMLSKMDLS